MATIHTVENGVQAKPIIEQLASEGYDREHIHVFAHNDKRAEDIADFLEVDSGKSGEEPSGEGLLHSIKSFFQTTPEDFHERLIEIGLDESELETAKTAIADGKLVIVAHHP